MNTRTICTSRFNRVLTNEEKLAFGNMADSYGSTYIAFEDKPLYTYKIERDGDHAGPRVEYDNLGVMHCAHKRYTLGDKGAPTPFVDDDYRAGVLRDDVLVCKPIYLYDHSGITISHGKFSCEWDSGLLGWHYMTTAVAEENWPSKTGTDLIAAALACLDSELNEYDAYLQGDVYGYVIENLDGDTEDSCWGYIGDDIETNGMLDNADPEHHAGLRAAWENRYE